jgi:protein-S-isoprenylcysteine O-methyltransferase Ste14
MGSPRPLAPRILGALRNLAALVLVGLLVAFSRPTPASVSFGFLFLALGEATRFWAAGHLHKTTRLVISGPYRHTRNPLYLGRLLLFTGLAVMSTLPYRLNWVVLALGYAVFFAYYLRRKERVEPARMRRLHGEAYERYYRAVPALLPRLQPYPEGSSSGWSSDRLIRNREHYTAIVLFALSLYLLWRAYR